MWPAGVIREESLSMAEMVASAAVGQVFGKEMSKLCGW